MGFFPFPCVAEEFFACEVAFAYSFFCEFVDYFCFGCDCRVVGSGYPEGVFAHESCPADEDVLDCVVEHMAHVEYSGDVWRRDYDCVGLAGVGLGVEQAVGHPVVIPFVLDCARVVFCG